MPDKPMRYALPAILFLALTLTACEGPTGPEGPEGPPGVANISVETFAIRDGDFSAYNDVAEMATYTMRFITSEVVNDGAVLAYTDLLGENWLAMPMTIPLQGATVAYTFSTGPEQFGLMVMRPDGSGRVASVFSGSRVKVVAIPPAALSDTDPQALQSMSYEEVAARFELE